jgi:hypothetical protein
MATLAELTSTYGVDVLEYLDRQADIPVLSGPQIQGDVSFLPVTTAPATTPVPAGGVVLAAGREGHAHRLMPGAFFDRAQSRDGSLVIGTMTVPDGAEGYVAHDEHGYTGFAPGTYQVGGQREYAGEWQRVAD